MYKTPILAIFLLISLTSRAIPRSNIPLENLALSQNRSIVLDNISIGGLKIGMSENEVIKKLGAPKSRQVSANGCTGNDDIALRYNNLAIYLERDSIKKNKSYLVMITTTNSRYVTNKGIRVGDSIGKAEQAYSKAAVTVEKGRYLSLVDPKHGECALSFSSDNSKRVNEISLFCAVC